MPVSSRTRVFTLAAAAGSVPLLLALSLHGQSAPVLAVRASAEQPNAELPNAELPDKDAMQMARQLDHIAQERFASARMVVFGISRISSAATTRQHVNSMAPETPVEVAALARVNASRRDYLVSFLHCASVPAAGPAPRPMPLPGVSVVFTAPAASPAYNPFFSAVSAAPGMLPAPVHPYLTPLIVHQPVSSMLPTPRLTALSTPGAPVSAGFLTAAPISPQSASLQQQLLLQAQAAMPRLAQGRTFSQTKEGWTLLLSPISASKDSCLTCHLGAKRGDTLGIMAYAVSNTVRQN